MGYPFLVQGGDNHDLQFTGRALASVNSHRPGYPRWTELNLFQTDAGAYVGQVVGRSTVDGETPRYWCNSGPLEEVLEMFTRDGILTWLGKELIEKSGVPSNHAVTLA